MVFGITVFESSLRISTSESLSNSCAKFITPEDGLAKLSHFSPKVSFVKSGASQASSVGLTHWPNGHFSLKKS